MAPSRAIHRFGDVRPLFFFSISSFYRFVFVLVFVSAGSVDIINGVASISVLFFILIRAEFVPGFTVFFLFDSRNGVEFFVVILIDPL